MIDFGGQKNLDHTSPAALAIIEWLTAMYEADKTIYKERKDDWPGPKASLHHVKDVLIQLTSIGLDGDLVLPLMHLATDPGWESINGHDRWVDETGGVGPKYAASSSHPNTKTDIFII